MRGGAVFILSYLGSWEVGVFLQGTWRTTEVVTTNLGQRTTIGYGVGCRVLGFASPKIQIF